MRSLKELLKEDLHRTINDFYTLYDMVYAGIVECSCSIPKIILLPYIVYKTNNRSK